MTRFGEFKERDAQLSERVEAVKERHKVLPGSSKDYATPMAGTTLAVYQQIEKDCRDLADDWLRRMDLWDRVEGLTRAQGPFGAGRYKEAGRLLNQLGSFDTVDDACRNCVAQLDKLEQGHEHARILTARAEETAAELRKQVESVRALPLPTGPYEEELQRCVARTEEGKIALPADPLGAVAALEDARKKLTALNHWMDEAARLFRRAGEAMEELEQVARQAASRRAGGLLLTEPGGNPDPLLEQGRGERAGALEALERADVETAARGLDAAFDVAKQAADAIERQAAAREHCAREVPARAAQERHLRDAEGEAASRRHELERDFAPDSWHEVADNLARARDLLVVSEGQLREAASASADGVQHYFRATELLDQVRRQQDESEVLIAGVGDCLGRLTELRQECYRQREEVGDLARRAHGYLADRHYAVRAPARARLDAAENALRQVRGEMDGVRPHWPAAHGRLGEARQGYTDALREAEADVRAHDQLTAKLTDVEREAERVGHFLRDHPEARMEANRTHRSAADALDRARRESAGRGADWAALLRHVEEAAQGLAKAERQARDDVHLAERARAEIAQAEHAAEQAHAHGFMGSLPIDGPVADLLALAQRHLAAQAYEQAAEQAAAAQKAARQSQEDAARRAREEQQRLDEERRRSEMAAAIPAAGAAALMASDAFGNPPPDSPPASSEQPPAEDWAAPLPSEPAVEPLLQDAPPAASEPTKPPQAN